MCRHVCVLSHFSHVRLLVTLGTVAYQAPLTMGFSRQKYYSGLCTINITRKRSNFDQSD